MKSRIDGVGIKAMSVAVPQKIIRVIDYLQCPDKKNIERVIRKTGIDSIRVSSYDQTTADFCKVAADSLFYSNYNKSSICAILFVSKTPDNVVLPPTSCLLQDRLGLGEEVLCYDSMAACYGFVGGLQIAGLLASSFGKDVLLLTGDTNSKIMNVKDSSSVMFGDGGAASIIGPMHDKFVDLHIKNKGSYANLAYVKSGGFRNPTSVESLELKSDERGNERSDCNMTLSGLEMMNFVLGDAADLIKETIAEYDGAESYFDVFALHQPNEMIVKSLIKCLAIAEKKVPLHVNGYGNISSASIPLSLCLRYQETHEKPNMALLAGFGGGASWGTAVTNLNDTDFYPVQEI